MVNVTTFYFSISLSLFCLSLLLCSVLCHMTTSLPAADALCAVISVSSCATVDVNEKHSFLVSSHLSSERHSNCASLLMCLLSLSLSPRMCLSLPLSLSLVRRLARRQCVTLRHAHLSHQRSTSVTVCTRLSKSLLQYRSVLL